MTIKVKNRHRLKKREIRDILDQLSQTFSGPFFTPLSSVEVGTLAEYTVIFVDDDIDFIVIQEKVFFTLAGLNKYHPTERFVTVDMGAVGFVTNGADVMAPGIVDADPGIQTDDQVWICDETHHKPLAVGVAMMNGEEMLHGTTGKAVKTIHYVGDTLWNLTSKRLVQ
jgi:PUA domain protein